MNDTIKSIHSRYSCRTFARESIPSDEILDVILRAALASPSASNHQTWQFVVCKNRKILDRAQEIGYNYVSGLDDKSKFDRLQKAGGKVFYDAPIVIFVTSPVGEEKSESLNTGIALQTIALAATSMGVDSLICGGFTRMCFSDEASSIEMSKILNFKDGYICKAAVLLGYSTQVGLPHELNFDKITMINM